MRGGRKYLDPCGVQPYQLLGRCVQDLSHNILVLTILFVVAQVWGEVLASWCERAGHTSYSLHWESHLLLLLTSCTPNSARYSGPSAG
jgi:hypothetical protein